MFILIAAMTALLIGRALTMTLPRLALSWRLRLFSEKGSATLLLPNDRIYGKEVERLFALDHTNIKRGTVFRKLIMAFHVPVDIHQENIDAGPVYRELAKATVRALPSRPDEIRAIAQKHLQPVCRALTLDQAARVTRLRQMLAPAFIRLYYELLFGSESTETEVSVIFASFLDILETVKGLRRRRNVELSERALRLIRSKLLIDPRDEIFGSGDASLSIELRAKHILGSFFHTGVVELTECVSHTLIEIAKSPEIEKRILAAGPGSEYLRWTIDESLRLFPLFGVTNRILAEDTLANQGAQTLPKGTQLLFNFQAHQKYGFVEPSRFRPERWAQIAKKEACFMPFGLGKRKCPAERFSLITTEEFVYGLLEAASIVAPIHHARELVGGGLCAWVSRKAPIGSMQRSCLAARVWGQDTLEILRDSVLRLTVFPRMAREALATSGNDKVLDQNHPPTPSSEGSSQCPVRLVSRVVRGR